MKKFIVILGLVASFMFVMPMSVKAAAFVDNDGDGVYENDAAISVGRYGSVAAGDMTWKYSDEEAGEKTWTISFDVSSGYNYVYFTLVPSFVEIDSVNVSSGSNYVLANQTSSSNGTVVFFESTSGGKLELTVVTTDTADEGCLLNISPLNLDCSVSIPGYYFDDNGKAITEEEYNQVCGNTTPDNPQDIPNSPDTGSVVPYIAIGGGLVAIAAVYLLSRKSNKVFKI